MVDLISWALGVHQTVSNARNGGRPVVEALLCPKAMQRREPIRTDVGGDASPLDQVAQALRGSPRVPLLLSASVAQDLGYPRQVLKRGHRDQEALLT